MARQKTAMKLLSGSLIALTFFFPPPSLFLFFFSKPACLVYIQHKPVHDMNQPQ